MTGVVGGYVIRWRPSQELVVLVCYTTALYMTVVDNTIIYTALPSLARDFHASLADAQWVTLSYLLTLALMIPSSGWIGDRFGTRRTFLLALALFTGASALCGLSGSLPQLVIFRVIQGIGGGLIIPVGQAMLFRTYPPERRARATGLVMLGTALGPATGPVLGGVLTTVPVLAVVLFCQRAVRHHRADHRAAVPGRAPRAGRGPAGHRRLPAGRRRPGAGPVRAEPGAAAGLGQPGRHRLRRHRPGRAGLHGGGRAAAEGADAEPAAAAQPDLPHHHFDLALPGVRLQRLPVHHAGVPAAGPRGLGAELRADHVPRRDRAADQRPDRRARLPPHRATADGRLRPVRRIRRLDR